MHVLGDRVGTVLAGRAVQPVGLGAQYPSAQGADGVPAALSGAASARKLLAAGGRARAWRVAWPVLAAVVEFVPGGGVADRAEMEPGAGLHWRAPAGHYPAAAARRAGRRCGVEQVDGLGVGLVDPAEAAELVVDAVPVAVVVAVARW